MAERCRLCYITDRTAFAPDEPTRRRRLLEKIDEATRSGIDYIQLREKDLPTRDLESLAREAVALLNKLKSRNPELSTALLINSRSDIALTVGADGVHLRSDDVRPQEVKQIWNQSGAPPDALIGISCHSASEVKQAEADRASFVVFAPVFVKKDAPASQPAGLTGLREACRAKIPVLALGGVSLENAKECLDAGAAGIAGIRLFQQNDIAKVVDSLRQLSRC
jgi:thiamine-phosphate pyrophosphorylase